MTKAVRFPDQKEICPRLFNSRGHCSLLRDRYAVFWIEADYVSLIREHPCEPATAVRVRIRATVHVQRRRYQCGVVDFLNAFFVVVAAYPKHVYVPVGENYV